MNLEENIPISVGPWGGQNGAQWNDGVYNSVRQVVICHGAAIDSIQFEYEKKGSSVWSDKHGGTAIKLDYPEEYLVSVSGHYGSIVDYGLVLVRSLTFESNKKKYGPFGIQHGTHFSFPFSVGKVVGFHGRSSWYLDSIGVYLKPLLQRNLPSNTGATPPSQSYRIPVAEKNNNLYFQGVINNAKDIPSGPAQTAPFLTRGGHGGAIFEDELESYTNTGIADNGTIYGQTTYTRKSVPLGARAGNGGAMYDYEAEKNSNPVGAINQSKDKSSGSTMSPRKSISYGPWGGSGGTIFDDGVYAGVREVHVTSCGGLVAIRVCYDSNGQAIWGNRNGESQGIRLDKIAFDYPSEILTHISGCHGSKTLRGPMVVKSLTFHTNKIKYGPFGEEQGISFSSALNKGRIVGFHGRKGLFVDSIGVHAIVEEPAQPSPSLSSSPWISHDSVATSDPEADEVSPGIVEEPAAATWGCGPWGGNGGKPWDDGVSAGVKAIYLTKGEFIYCIQIEYDRNGQSVWSARHGSGSERSSHMIKLDYPTEVLTGISGYMDSVSGDETKCLVKSLSFYTNKAKYGPYGEESGTPFPSTKTEGRIVGFHGRSGCYLNSVGVRMQPWPSERDLAPQGGLGDWRGAVKSMPTPKVL